MQKPPLFFPKDDNLGGLVQIQLQHYNHRKSLKNAKSVINSLKPPHPHVNTTTIRNSHRNTSFTKQSFIHDSVSSDTFWISPSGVKERPQTVQHNKYVMEEHQRELSLLRSKIRNGKTLTERKKNPYDASIKPAIIFRDKSKKVSDPLDSMALKDYGQKTYKFSTKVFPMGPSNYISNEPSKASCLDGMSLYESSVRRGVNRTIKKWQPEEQLNELNKFYDDAVHENEYYDEYYRYY